MFIAILNIGHKMHFKKYSICFEKLITSICSIENNLFVSSDVGTPVMYDGEKFVSICSHIGNESGIKRLFCNDGYLCAVTIPSETVIKINTIDRVYTNIDIKPPEETTVYFQRNDFVLKDKTLFVSGFPINEKVNCFCIHNNILLCGMDDGFVYSLCGIKKKR